MTDIKELLRLNPKAAAGYESVKKALESMKQLREAGVAKGDQTRPIGRQTADLKPARRFTPKGHVQTDI